MATPLKVWIFLPDLSIKTQENSPTIPIFEQQNPYFHPTF